MLSSKDGARDRSIRDLDYEHHFIEHESNAKDVDKADGARQMALALSRNALACGLARLVITRYSGPHASGLRLKASGMQQS